MKDPRLIKRDFNKKFALFSKSDFKHLFENYKLTFRLCESILSINFPVFEADFILTHIKPFLFEQYENGCTPPKHLHRVWVIIANKYNVNDLYQQVFKEQSGTEVPYNRKKNDKNRRLSMRKVRKIAPHTRSCPNV